MQNRYPTRSIRTLLAAALALTLPALVTGCGTSRLATGNSDSGNTVQPQDFVGQPEPYTPTSDRPTTLIATDTPGAENTTDPGRDTPASNDARPINAMVGHINGEAVYADLIFDVNVAAQLMNFGQRFDDRQFLMQASRVIQKKLRGIIEDKLILGEAERNLKDNQRRAIDIRVASEREELLRFYGQGSLAKAKADFLAERGLPLEDHLRTFEERLLISSYVQSKVMPKIVVNKRDIDQWYEDHKAQYNQPDRRVFRIIRATSPETAQQITRRLKRGEAFEQVASDSKLNIYNAVNGGIFNGGEELSGDRVYAIDPVNEALLPLKDGEYAGPILAGKTHFFVQIVTFKPGLIRTLDEPEVQLQIVERMRLAQFEKHGQRFRKNLYEQGSYTNPVEMGEKLLAIAQARYDR